MYAQQQLHAFKLLSIYIRLLMSNDGRRQCTIVTDLNLKI